MWSTIFTTLFGGLFLIAKYTAGDGQCVTAIGGGCPLEWGLWRGNCYNVTETLTWLEAKQECDMIGGMMAVPQSSEEISYFNTLQDEYWIGCTDLEEEGTWVCLEGANFTGRWHSSEPGGGHDENCMEIYDGALNDKPCGDLVHAICKRATLPKLHL